MARSDILTQMVTNKMSPLQFNYDLLQAPPLRAFIPQYVISELRDIANDARLASKPKERRQLINELLFPLGFKLLGAGTNRLCYRYLDDYRYVIKVAVDRVALSDNINEFVNQQVLKPFVCKCFEVTPCGTVGLFERVDQITTREQFLSIGEDVFELLNVFIDGRYILEDIGTDYYLNYGIRHGFGPVLLDYAYMYELDGKKLRCNKPDPDNPIGTCDGLLDYDDGFNNIICTKCGKRYIAKDLKKDIESHNIIMKDDRKGVPNMNLKIRVRRGSEVLEEKTLGEEKTSSKLPKGSKEFKVLVKKLATIIDEKPVEEPAKVEEVKEEFHQQDKEEVLIDNSRYNENKSMSEVPKMNDDLTQINIHKVQEDLEKKVDEVEVVEPIDVSQFEEAQDADLEFTSGDSEEVKDESIVNEY